MISLKRRNLIFLLVVALVVGAVASGGYLTVRDIRNDTIALTLKQFEEYEQLKEDYGDLDELKSLISEKYYVPVEEEDLREGIRKGLFWGIGDPYSAYLTKEEYDNLKISTTGEFEGIGVTIAPDERGYIHVVAPLEGTPADKAGIKAGDKVISVDDKEFMGDAIDAAATAMRGKEGTSVKIGILRDGERLDFTIIRDSIILETIRSEVLEEENLGYIRITSFEERTGSDFAQALRDMELSGVKGLIIDLRNNPGGMVHTAVEVADQLLPAGVITYMEDRQGEREYLKSKAGATNLPFVLLVNENTASSSEILAAAVKDMEAGALVGGTTFGKGIIQEIVPLENGGATKLTIMQYFSPEGRVIHKEGIEPNYAVEWPIDEETGEFIEEDPQLQKSMELLR